MNLYLPAIETVSAMLVPQWIEYDTALDPEKGYLFSSGVFQVCLMCIWKSPSISLLDFRRSVIGLRRSIWTGMLGLRCPYRLWITRMSTVLRAQQMQQVRKSSDILQKSTNITDCLWKLDCASGFFRVRTLCFHQRTSVDPASHSPCPPSIHSHLFPHDRFLSRITGVEGTILQSQRASYYLLEWQQWRQCQIPGHWMHCKHRNPHQLPRVLESARSHQAEVISWSKAERKM